ncbi:MAG: hypothetical protein KC561_10115 [Myxococcales bacterium]|nr:hypothetical protein [Myxococcales bacterium]
MVKDRIIQKVVEAVLTGTSSVLRTRATLCVVSLCLLGALSCSGYEVTQTPIDLPAERTELPTLVITPPQFFLEHDAFQVVGLTSDLASTLTVDHGIPTIAPWEYDPDGRTTTMSSSDAMVLATENSPVSLQNALLLDFRIDGAQLSRAIATPVSMGGGVRANHESEVLLTLSLRSFPDGEPVGSVSLRFEEDLLGSDATPANPRPALRNAVREAAGLLAAEIHARWPFGTPSDAPALDLVFNPTNYLDYSHGTNPAVSEELNAMDELDRLAVSYAYYQYFDPAVTTAMIRQFSSSPPGLLVRSLPNPLGQLQPGDFVVAIDGEPVRAGHVLHRAFQIRESGDRFEVAVSRDGQRRVLPIEVP